MCAGDVDPDQGSKTIRWKYKKSAFLWIPIIKVPPVQVGNHFGGFQNSHLLVAWQRDIAGGNGINIFSSRCQHLSDKKSIGIQTFRIGVINPQRGPEPSEVPISGGLPGLASHIGIAMAASKPIMATTSITSINVKPIGDRFLNIVNLLLLSLGPPPLSY
jgi:hypothetical protein